MQAEEKINYLEIRNAVEKEVVSLGYASNKVKVSFEKDEFQLELKVEKLDDASFIHTMILAKKHWENWRIHTFENGFLSLQALNKNIFHSDDILKNIKIRLSGIYGEKILEISKKKPLTQSEISLNIELVKYFLSQEKKDDPMETIKRAGCSIYKPDANALNFDSLGGYQMIKDQVEQAVLLPLKNKDIIQKITRAARLKQEATNPKAILFSGPPGVGKTSMARIIANEAGYLLVYVPIESIMSSYYGESSKRLASIFDSIFAMNDQAPNKMILLFLDEIDSLALSREERLFEASRRLLSVLLRKIDGIESKSNCLTLGATNRKDDLDKALLSRFDTIIEFPYPSGNDLLKILDMFTKHLNQEEKKILASTIQGRSPRFIRDICNQAERLHARTIIEKGVKMITPPPLAVYRKIVALNKDKDQ